MKYLLNISSFADLKKKYRALAVINHPDKGGDTTVMQQINAEFEKLYKLWENKATENTFNTGYENDYAGATAKQYSDYVYNEYKWKGRNYKGQRAPEIILLIRKWLKETYPTYKFSVTRRHYNSLNIYLLSADFEVFISNVKDRAYKQINHYHLNSDKELTDRAREVMANIIDFANSYNYDNSDIMTDYFDTNFYLQVGIGNSLHPYKIVTPKLKCKKGDEPKAFNHPEGPAHKAMRQALGSAKFSTFKSMKRGQIVVLGEYSYRENGDTSFYPLTYASAKTAQKRIDKLMAVGITCKLTGYNSGYIEFLRYTHEVQAQLEHERKQVIEAYEKWAATNKAA